MLEPGKTREFERAMAELQQGLWIVKTEERYEPTFSYRWDLLERWLPGGGGGGPAARRAAPPSSSSVAALPARRGVHHAAAGSPGCSACRRRRPRPRWRRWLGPASPARRDGGGLAGPLGGERAVSGTAPGGELALGRLPVALRDVIGSSPRPSPAMRPPGWWAGRCGTSSGRAAGGARPGGARRRAGAGRRRLADRLGAAYIVLDEARGVCRLAGPVQIDLADFRAPTIEADLRARDFTVNALAVPLRALAADRARPCDRSHRRPDRSRRAARPALRARRSRRRSRAHPARGAARPAPGMAARRRRAPAARAAAPRPGSRVAAERVRDELGGMLEGPRAGQGLRLLDDLGALAVLLPESRAMRATAQPEPHHFDVWEHSLRTVEGADAVLAAPGRGLRPVTSSRTWPRTSATG